MSRFPSELIDGVKRTRKPCDACGGERQFRAWREVGKVCEGCQKLLSEALSARAHEDVDPEIGNYYLADEYHDLPYFRYVGVTVGGSDKYRTFQQTFHRLCHLLGQPITHVFERDCTPIVDVQPVTRPGTKLRGGIKVSMPKAVAECLDILYQEAMVISRVSYEGGKAKGESFITRLAEGEVSIAEYNKETINGGNNGAI